ncbi:type II CAAX prenyl endopeptidase Rce1 family protein [Ruminococcus flavefaciens]|uniref:CPBP family glutamic-type intramembrane protease n=1 Tax=Ruminococcus flavefaciens TaxID=1265 RepID=UPI00048A9B0C|nr:CPBP family glutamic-type intramembrane protease [Ruminococcus flavefaciens]
MNKTSHLKYFLPARCILFLFIFIAGAFIMKQEVSDISNWWSIVASAVNILTIFFLVISAKKAGSSYGELIGLQKGKTPVKKMILLIIGFIFIGMAGLYGAGYICYGVLPYSSPMMVEPISLILAILNIAVLPVTTALAEDGLYLGGGVNQIKSKYAAILVPAFFYALQHCFIPTLFDAKYMIYRFISFLPLTVIFCIHYHKNRDPLPIMIAHAILDLATAMTILATSADHSLYEKMINI